MFSPRLQLRRQVCKWCAWVRPYAVDESPALLKSYESGISAARSSRSALRINFLPYLLDETGLDSFIVLRAICAARPALLSNVMDF